MKKFNWGLPLIWLGGFVFGWIASNHAHALSSMPVATTAPGANVCATVSPAAGSYYIRATATDADGNESALSNEVVKALPDQVCWLNPTQNIDGSAITDLALVTIYWSADPITGTTPDPPIPGITLAVDCGAFTCQDATVVLGQTGAPIQVTWNTTDGPFAARIFEWPSGAIPVAQAGNISGNSFTWTPAKAGVYSMSVDGQIFTSTITLLFYVKLAPPSGGGIE